jgi:hypothetical protein
MRAQERCRCDTPGLCRHARDIAHTATREGRPPARRWTVGPARTRETT